MGATGVTGKQVTRYLTQSHPTLKIAIAGRNPTKLSSVVSTHGRPSLPTLVVDSFDIPSLKSMVSKTKVVIALSGPYTKYGYPLATVCAQQGVHYVDLSGEFFYQRRVIDGLEDIASSTGSKIVVAGGYDSTPFDLAAHIAVKSLPDSTNGDEDIRVVSIVDEMHGYLSGGTLASMIAGVSEAITETLSGKGSNYANDPYILTPYIQDCEKVDVDPTGWGNFLRYDRDVAKWGIQHFMAYVNSRIVRRSMNMMGVTRVSYSEGLSVYSMVDAAVWAVPWWFKGGFKVLPSPGEGPSEEFMKEGGFKVTTIARRGEDTVKVNVVGKGDPGYGHTSKVISEIAVCLTDGQCHNDVFPEGVGGVFTPSTACGEGLRKGLEGVLDFKVEMGEGGGKGGEEL
ncbi:hypothetical protein TrCOL_g7031 [Triparma columacea]|uniref:Saccharopine dehydrogenase NADP binding domain-containing protein n=1 Tax=Triparma columacea TaxID=722753 RepID=A0A9W7G0E5_9STRA|nr:hypothetical protein TrCOL_g7031 [Triparma columacea]